MKKYLMGSVLFASVLVTYAQVKPSKEKIDQDRKSEKLAVPEPPKPPAPPLPPLPPLPVAEGEKEGSVNPPPAPEAPLPPPPPIPGKSRVEVDAPPPPPQPAPPPVPKRRIIHL